MNNKNLLLIVLAVVIGVVVIVSMCKYNFEKEDSEGYINVPQAAYFADDVNAGYQYRDSQILSRPNYKPHYPPNFYDGSSAAQLKGPQPPLSARGERLNPMEFVSMVSDSQKLPAVIENVAVGEFKALKNFDDPLKYQDVSLPETNMEAMNFGKDPNDPNTYVHDRLIYANQKRRNRTNADLIRGDIPIANINAHKGWNQVSVVPHLDTVVGALGSGFVGSAFEHTGAQYQTNVSQSGDVNVIREISENAIPVSIERF